ncbi:hypothetical protein L798_15313 [Zootermopsis nevadensis]|uniref:Uncharacterized protein n=1 Tax=Zootermopsis nevadensis TaxID=136037 RepID=A0A067QLB5_ZOONE|nr:hypothetical protein L798_15313 [Zootermopsis nevadensis]
MLLNLGTRFLGKHSNLLMAYLAVSTSFHHSHNNILSRHKREFLRDVTFDNFWVHDNSLTYVLQRHKDTVGRQESFSQCDPPAEIQLLFTIT